MFISPFWSTSLSTGFLLSLLFPLCVSVFQFVQHAPFPLFCSSTQSFLWAPSLPVFWTLHLIGWLSLQCLVHLFLIFIFREWVGREKESKTNINVLLPLAWPILGTWMANQAHALTGNWTASLWFTGWHFTHWLTADRHLCCNVELLYHLGQISLSHCTSHVPRGGALGICHGRTTHFAVLWCCLWGKGQGGNNPACSSQRQLSVNSPSTFKQTVLCGSNSVESWLVYLLAFEETLEWTLVWDTVFPTAASSTGFHRQKFYGFSFLCWKLGLWCLSHFPIVLHVYL